MAIKKPKPEEIVVKFWQAEVQVGQGMPHHERAPKLLHCQLLPHEACDMVYPRSAP
jgi:hypothetical protein